MCCGAFLWALVLVGKDMLNCVEMFCYTVGDGSTYHRDLIFSLRIRAVVVMLQLTSEEKNRYWL